MSTIPEEKEVASVKDSVRFGLPSHEHNVGAEASGSGSVPAWSLIGKFGIYEQKVGEDIIIEKKRALAASKTEEKGGLSMDPMVTP